MPTHSCPYRLWDGALGSIKLTPPASPRRSGLHEFATSLESDCRCRRPSGPGGAPSFAPASSQVPAHRPHMHQQQANPPPGPPGAQPRGPPAAPPPGRPPPGAPPQRPQHFPPLQPPGPWPPFPGAHAPPRRPLRDQSETPAVHRLCSAVSPAGLRPSRPRHKADPSTSGIEGPGPWST